MWQKHHQDKFREGGFPGVIIWTKDWESCNPEITQYFAARLEYYLWMKPYVNVKYKWWYVTTQHGLKNRKEKDVNNNSANNSIRNMIQIELWRFLYMKKSTQEVDWERMEIIWEGLKRAIADTGIKFDSQYFENLKK
jgi:N-formylglutamate amidohydrolase